MHPAEVKKIEGNALKEETFESFFIRFRDKARNGDMAGIKGLTMLPIKTRGGFDFMPYRYVAENEFDNFYDYFSREFGGGKYYEALPNPLQEDTNLYELLHADLSRDLGGSLDGAEYYLGNWEFKKINGKWYFAFAYTDYFENNRGSQPR